MFWKNARLLGLVAVVTLTVGVTACKKKTMEEPAKAETAMMDADAMKGKELYDAPAKGNCVSCHGTMGKGDGPAGAALKARDLTDASGYKQGAGADAIAETIKSGVKGGPGMPARADLPEADRKMLAKYVVSLQK